MSNNNSAVPTEGHDTAVLGWNEFEDALTDAIMDSFEPDWRASDGARAVIQWLNDNAPRVA